MGEQASGLVVVPGRLGIPYAVISPLYKYAHGRVVSLLGVDSIDDALEADAVTRVLLVMNADFGSVWHVRKRLLLDGRLTLDAEIKFIDLVYTKHFKAQEAWAHRRWLFLRHTDAPARRRAVQSELAACERAADCYPKNYMAWTHRHFVARHLDSDELIAELNAHLSFAVRHVSDHASFQYRSFLLDLAAGLFSPPKAAALLQAEAEFNTELITRFPGHEALWCHRRFLAARGALAGQEELAWCASVAADPTVAKRGEQDRCARAYALFRKHLETPLRGEELYKQLTGDRLLSRARAPSST